MHFFDKNGNLTHCSAQLRADVKELFFREVILHQFLKRKKWALLGKNVQAILTLLNLAQKVQFLEDLKKKVSESDWNQRHIVYVTQIHYYTREYRPTTWAFLLGPAGGNFILFLLLKATHKKILLATLNTLLG